MGHAYVASFPGPFRMGPGNEANAYTHAPRMDLGPASLVPTRPGNEARTSNLKSSVS